MFSKAQMGVTLVLVGFGALATPAAAVEPDGILVEDPYYLSVHEPDGSVHEPDGEVQGTVLTMHGGGWKGDLGPRADQRIGRWIEELTTAGYRVANLAYRRGRAGLRDSLAAFDFVRHKYGGPVCLWGQSAGAHLSLVVAARRRDEVACVVDFSGPSNLRNWGVKNPKGPWLARRAFGVQALKQLSPVRHVARITAPVLVAGASCDRMLGMGQQRRFAIRLRRSGSPVRFHEFRPGDSTYVPHCQVSQWTLDRFFGKQRQFLAAALGAPD